MKKQISRKDFLKGFAATGLAAVAITALGPRETALAGVTDNLPSAAENIYIGANDPGHNNGYLVWFDGEGVQHYRKTPEDDWQVATSVWS